MLRCCLDAARKGLQSGTRLKADWHTSAGEQVLHDAYRSCLIWLLMCTRSTGWVQTRSKVDVTDRKRTSHKMPDAKQGTHERPFTDMDTLTDQRMTDTSYQVFRTLYDW